MPMSSKSLEPRPRCGYFRFFMMAAAAILHFWHFKFLTVWTVKRAELRQHAKFRQNRSKRGRNIAIFRCLKMAAAAISDFRNFTFLTVGTVKSVERHQHAKYRHNRLNRGWDIAIFRFSKMAADGRHLGFLQFQTFNGLNGHDGRTA